MKNLFLSLLLCLPAWIQAQNLLEGTIRDLNGNHVTILSFYGEKTTRLDSVKTNTTGHFRYLFPARTEPGMFRVQWSKEGHVNLVWDREDVIFSTTREGAEDSLRIISSAGNRISLDYSAIDRVNQEKLRLLLPLIDYYPVKDSFYAGIAAEMERIQRSQVAFLDSVTALFPEAYAVRMARVYQSPFIPASMEKEERMNYLKQHYWDNVDFGDTALLRSPVFANKAISYMSLYGNTRLQQKQLEAEFIKAVTVMLSAASVNAEIYKFLLDYLVSGFDKYHFDDVITYIADNFQDPFSCEDQTRKTALQKKLDTFKKLSPGNTAPEIEIADQKGKIVKLTGIAAEYTLVIFWSTQCPHCTSMIPRIKEIYDSQKPRRFEVMAVSIDTSRTAWTSFIRNNKLTWINVSELKGFAGKSTDDYNIYATPTLFLLDRQKKILAKPVSLRETEETLREYDLMEP